MMILIPHSTDVTSEQALALLESLIPTLGLDPAQEIGVRNAIEELHDLASGGGLDAQLEEARGDTRSECEADHDHAIKVLERQHADALDTAREESREAGYELGALDAEAAIEIILTPQRFGEFLEAEDDGDFQDHVNLARKRREVAEREAEREREAMWLAQLAREQAERDRLAAVRKRGAPRKPRAKKAGSK